MPLSAPNCGSCWLKHQKCSHKSMSSGRCSYCVDHITPGLNDARTSIEAADQFPKTEFRQALLPIIASHVLDTDAANLRTIILDLPIIDDAERKITSEYSGNFDITNQSLMKPFNESFHRKFAAKLVARDSTCPHVDNACLAGAYLHVFCSAEFNERGDSFRESLNEEDSQQSSIEAHLRFLMLCRIAELVETVLRAIRHIEGGPESEVAYAAAVLLCHEANFFGSSMKYGTTFNHIRKDIRDMLGRWLMSVSRELGDHVREGCARHQRWNSVIRGSLKKFKGLQHFNGLLKIRLSLQHHSVSLPERDEWPPWASEPIFASEGYPLLSDILVPHGETIPKLQHDALFSQSSITPNPTSLLAFSNEAANLASHYLGIPNFTSETTPEFLPNSLESMDIDEYIDPQLSTFSHFVAGPNQDSILVPFDHESSMENLFYDNHSHDRDLLNVHNSFDIDPNIFHPSSFPYFSIPSPDDALN